ncbi:glycosyltransferase [Thermodesulfobacteriota bacterium]
MAKDARVRIIHIITGLNQGGAEAMLFKILPHLKSRFDIHVVSLMDEGVYGGKIKENDISLNCLYMRRGEFMGGHLLRLRTLLKRIQPDIIQSWMYHSNLIASVVRMLIMSKPAIAWNVRHSISDLSHERSMTRQVIRANRFLSRGVDRIVYNSRISREQHERFGFAPENGLIIPNGIDVNCFIPSIETRWRVRSELGISEDAVVVGHVARMHPMKNHLGFLRVAVNLAKRYIYAHFVLVGNDVTLSSGSLSALIPEEVRGRFHLLGSRTDVSELMSVFDVFCLSSVWGEAFPNVLGEAMATEVPCVTTNVGDCALIIGNTGVVVPPWDEDALLAGIESLLKMSSEKRRKLGERARARIEANYTLRGIVEKYVELYEELALKN